MKLLSRILPPLIVFLVAFAIFTPSIAYPLVDYDDMAFIARNRLVLGGLSLPSLKAAFTTLHGDAAMYSPLLWISWMADVSLFRASVDAPWPFHFGNVLLHALNAVLLYFILRRCRASPWPAVLLALLWALHPLRVESVAWVTERKDTLSTLFAFLSILFYLKSWERGRPARDGGRKTSSPSTFHFSLFTFHCGKGRLCLALAAFAAGLLVKPMLVTLPFLFLLFDVFPLRRVSLDRSFSFRAALRLLLEKIPFFALSAAASAVSLLTQTNAIHPAPLLHRLSLVPLHYAFYLIKTFIPVRLTPFYHSIVFSWNGIIPFGILFALLLLSAWRRRGTHPAWSLGILAFFGLFVPVIGFFHVGIHHIADRYSYLPAIGLSIAAIPLLASPRPLLRRASFAVALLALAAFVPLTLRTLRTWSSVSAFYDRAEAIFPDHPAVAAYRANALISDSGDFAAAEARVDAVLADYPDDDQAPILKAVCLDERLGPDAALEYLLNLRAPGIPPPIEAREAAQYALRAGKYDLAQSLVSSAISALPASDKLVADLREIAFAAAFCSGDHAATAAAAAGIPRLASRGSFSLTDLFPFHVSQWARHRRAAWDYFRTAAQADWDSPPNLNNLAWLLATAPGWSPAPPEDVLAIARRAAELAPDHPVILDTLAAALANASRFPEAVETASRAADLARDDPGLAAKIRGRLALYRQGLPYRETS